MLGAPERTRYAFNASIMRSSIWPNVKGCTVLAKGQWLLPARSNGQTGRATESIGLDRYSPGICRVDLGMGHVFVAAKEYTALRCVRPSQTRRPRSPTE